MSRYVDRRHAGRILASELMKYAGQPDVVVLALPRGGVPVAYEVARRLGAPLDVFVVRKLGVPGHEELAMGALASGGVRVLNEDLVGYVGLPDSAIDEVIARESTELARRERLYRGDRPPLSVAGKTVILVDDGLATGSTMRAAVEGLRLLGPRRIVAGAPVASRSTCEQLAPLVDDIVCAATPEPFYAVGQWYAEFTQTSDEEVRSLLQAAARAERSAAGTGGEPPRSAVRDVTIATSSGVLEASWAVPPGARAAVLFAHGTGSGRHSTRNRYVASVLQSAGFATLLLDLLTSEEEEAERVTRHLRFDIELLADRLIGATEWVRRMPESTHFSIGYFGASTGAAAALVAAARAPDRIGAVVSRGGRPDLAGEELQQVRAATLLVVGGADAPVLELNRKALALLTAETKLVIVPDATHLFQEAGALERVARLATDWFTRHLGAVPRARPGYPHTRAATR